MEGLFCIKVCPFRHLRWRFKMLSQLAYMLNSSDLGILVCCLGIVEVETNKTSIQIMAPDYITFEGLSIYNYITLKAS